MRVILLTLVLIIFFSNHSKGQCYAPTTVFASNINYYNAHVNWNTSLNVHHYKIRYKEVNSNSWLYKYNISATLNTKLLNNLMPLSQYIWQIMTHCDSTNTNTSSWSLTDTFTTISSTCPNTTNIYTTHVDHNSATVGWDTVYAANRYKVHYRKLGDTIWSNLAFIYHPTDSATIPILQQNTSYEWQIMTFHDSTNLASSLWSASDTFTTTTFIPAAFDPIVSNTLSNHQCNMPTELMLIVSQLSNEPDIGTSEITSDGGYFDFSSFTQGDSVGYAIMTTSNQTIEATLRLGMNLGSLAIINSVDSAGNLIGLFTIENQSTGIKVSSTSPNDGNNYTSGYTSIVNFANLFVNPPNAGPLHFFINIESELSDQILKTDTVQIACNTSIINNATHKKSVVATYDILGRQQKINNLSFIKSSDGKIQKSLIIKY